MFYRRSSRWNYDRWWGIASSVHECCSNWCTPYHSTGKYKTQLYESNRQEWLPSSPGIGMHVEVSPPSLPIMTSINHFAPPDPQSITEGDVISSLCCWGAVHVHLSWIRGAHNLHRDQLNAVVWRKQAGVYNHHSISRSCLIVWIIYATYSECTLIFPSGSMLWTMLRLLPRRSWMSCS